MTTPQELKELEDQAIAEAEAVGHRLTHISGAADACGELSVCMPVKEAERIADLLDAAAMALDIAADRNLGEIDIRPLPGHESDVELGWCLIRALAEKLREGRDVRKVPPGGEDDA